MIRRLETGHVKGTCAEDYLLSNTMLQCVALY